MKSYVKVISAAACAALLAGLFSVCAYAEDNSIGRVRVTVSQEKYISGEGQDYMVDEWVDLYETSTAVSLLKDLLAKNDLTQTGADDGYITEIGGLSAGDGGAMSGWMFLLDNWVTDEAVTAYTVASGKLRDGDEICFAYSLDYGADLGYDWSGTDTSLSKLGEYYELTPEFSPEIKEYTLNLSEGEQSVHLAPAAKNKAFRVKQYKNEYTPEDSSKAYSPDQLIEVEDGDVIYIGVGDPAWQSFLPEGTETSVYTVTINGGFTPYDPSKTDDGSVEFINQDITVPEILDAVSETAIAKAGDVWDYMTLARLGKLTEDEKKEYLDHVRDLIANENEDGYEPTAYEKNAIVLTAVGEDASDFEGTNMFSRLADHAFIKEQGLNASIFALIAFDTNKNDIPEAKDGAEQTTREALINDILSAELTGGGWAFWGNDPDVDMTAMALTSLAPYVSSDENVKAAVERGLDFLSKAQKDNAFFNYGSRPSTDSTAQVITALCSLGIDPTKDERFIKNGKNVIDAIKVMYSPEDKAFYSIDLNINDETERTINTYSTTQAFYALCAYQRLTEGKTRLFDMTDVSAAKEDENTGSGENDNKENTDKTDDQVSPAPTEDNTQQNNNGGNNTAANTTGFATGDDFAATVTILAFAAAVSAAAAVLLRKRRTDK